MNRFEGKVALVTGGGSGIGRAAALAFAREGARVLVANRSDEAGGSTVAAICAAGGVAAFKRTDVSKADDVEAMIAFVVEKFGRLDVAFNNAAVGGVNKPLHEHTDEEFDEVQAINVRGVFLSMKHEICQMLAQGGGVILNTSSINGLCGVLGNQAAYTTSKFAVLGLTRTAARDYATKKIRVNALAPAGFVTPMLRRAVDDHLDFVANLLPMKRVADVDEIVGAITFLCSDEASFITGHTLAVDGGFLA